MTELHLVVWKRPKMTDLVIKTIERNTKPGTYELKIWDNNKANVGLEAGRQNLLMDTKTPYFVCVDNDCLPPDIEAGQDWLERMIELIEKYPDYAAIAMRTQVMIGTGNIFEDESKEITKFPHPGGSFRIMRTDIVKAVGGWDRGEAGRGSEERYICGKLIDGGWDTGFATHIKCLHLFGTRGGNGTDKWGYPAGWLPKKSGHSDIHHPALEQGDSLEEVIKYSGEDYANSYFAG